MYHSIKLLRNNTRTLISFNGKLNLPPTRTITSLLNNKNLNSKQEQQQREIIDFKQELSSRFYKAIDDNPIDPAKFRLKDDVPGFVKQTGSFKKIFDSATKNLESPPSPYDLTLSSLLTANLHLGHSTSLWNPKTSPFIFGIRHGINIINLDYTLIYLRRACKAIKEISYNDGIILFINTRGGGFSNSIIKAARRCNQYQLTTRWLPGTITNSQQILENEIVLEEARQGNVPTIGVIDTDFDPNKVTWPIPANDDSVRGIELLVGVLSVAAKDGLIQRKLMLDKIEKERRRGK
ncbi:14692_t:CDS:2 [Funneliformis mosseae]|uniref:14692_t:CDS:1 n=1 Tax=Funneliformis mosseae TaxID=27381 RepID=A0A9N8ZEQ1_FUNMO|nr:14692_t:CDS:2 [Funneliformis mosseae]